MDEMPIPVVKVIPEWLEGFGPQHCIFCSIETAYVYYPRNIPVCKDCAKSKSFSSLMYKLKAVMGV
jgi:hypothetical protein